MTSERFQPRNNHETATSRSLLADARQDDADAWQRLVQLYSPLIVYWCRRQSVDEQDITDILQDVFTAVAHHLSRFRSGQPGQTFRGWLATITRNKIHDSYRRRVRQPRAAGGTEAATRLAQVLDPEAKAADGSGAEPTEEPTDEAAVGELLHRALEAIRGEFHERTWQAFWQVVVEEKSVSDVAQQLAMTQGNVRVAKSRVLMRLRRELGDDAAR